jgi:membrane protein YqaA with SNARE-associated domain
VFDLLLQAGSQPVDPFAAVPAVETLAGLQEPATAESAANPTNATGETGGTLRGLYEGLRAAVETATGWVGVGIVFVYSFLIAFALPLPSEVVLVAPLELGLPEAAELALIVVVSGAGKALGSVFAFALGQEAKEAGPIVRALRRSRFDVVEWSERKTVDLAREYGYAGLAMALTVPGFPDTLSIYAFSVLGDSYTKFAAATFAGSVGRLLFTLAVAGGALAVL